MDNLVRKIKPQIIIQVRMGSTRLPSKVMMPINGVPMIGYQIERLLQTGIPIIVATSDNKNNDSLVNYLESFGVDIFRGSEDNVLERYFNAAKLYEASDIIRITGDNPLINADFITKQLDMFSPKTNRYYLHEGPHRKLPLGLSFEMFSIDLLEEAYKEAQTKGEIEHVTPYMHQNMPGDIEMLEFNIDINYPDARLTVDTMKDFKLIEELIIKHQCHLKNTDEIVKILKDNSVLLQMNIDVSQKKWNE
jgi:spore coat polysaccharide biosynthesis protein SpsF (cytidylyltransferase family)